MNKKKISVIGLGYIGLPTASMFATHGYKVLGVDSNPSVVSTLKNGEAHIEEPGLATVVKAAVSSGNLTVDIKPSPADVFIIAVPTPYQHAERGIPTADLSYVKSAMESILPHLKKGDLVILESTCPPGTTQSLIIPMIEKKGFSVGADIGAAYCPERVIPGQALKELIGNDRVVGAVNEQWAETTKKLYKSFVSGEVFLTTPTVAEMVKVIENTYRDVNIAFANEAAILCEKMGISVWDVIGLANRHPRVNIHKPGPGVGGHCISVDPWFLVEMFPNDAQIIQKARRINDSMPNHVVECLETLLSDKPKAKVALLGLAYKGNVDDMRESPSVSVLKLLKKKHPEYSIVVADPHVKSKDIATVPLMEAFKDADIAVLLTPHDEFKALDPQEVGPLMKAKVIFDTHHVLKTERWVPAGFKMFALGTGGIKSKSKTS